MARDANVNIKTKADTKGAEKAAEAVDEVTKKTKKLTDEQEKNTKAQKKNSKAQDENTKAQEKNTNAQKKNAEETGKASAKMKAMAENAAPLAESFSSVGAAINLVNPQVGMMIQGAGMLTNGIKGLTKALMALVKNPIAWAIMGIVAVIGYFTNKIKAAREEMQKMVDGLGNVSGIEERNQRVKKSYDEMSRAIENTNDKLAHQHELEDMAKQNFRAQSDANVEFKKQKELAGAGSEKARQEIEDKYARQKIELEASRKRVDVREKANRTYTHEDAQNFEKQRQQSAKEIAVQKATIAGIEGSLENNRKVVTGATKTGIDWKKGLFGISDDVGVADKEHQETAKKNISELMKKLNEAKAALDAMEANKKKNDREEQQAKEKKIALMKEINVIEAQEKAELEALKTQIKLRKDSEAKMAKENERSVNETLKNDKKQGKEWQWGKDYEKAKTDEKRKMLEEKIKRAKEEAERARKDMQGAAQGDPNDSETARRLSEAQQRFNENQGIMRSATDTLDALNKQKEGVTGFKLSDRISAIGGFATAGAKAVSGINANTPESRALKEAEKQTRQGEAIKESVKTIERNTSMTMGCFA